MENLDPPTPQIDEMVVDYDDDSIDYKIDSEKEEMEAETVPKKLNFIELLQHFSTYTGMLLDDLTYLLQLFKENEPVNTTTLFIVF